MTKSDVTVADVDFDTLYRRHRSALVRSVRLAGATEDEANDAVQTAFAQFLLATSTIRDPHAWLRRVALNDFLSATPHIPSKRRKMIETPIPPQEVPEPATSMPSAADAAALNEENRLALIELALLSGKQRQVMVAYYDGLSHEQIADLLGMRTAAVRQNLSRARKRLRKRRAMTQEDAS
ncbi:MAG: RNA polymerase sigma factor [Pseudonocardiaceae bacterium]